MNLEQLVNKFAEATKIDAKLAKRIIDRLDAKGMSPEDMNGVLWRMKDWFMKNEYSKFLKGVKDDVIDAVIDDMIAWQAQMESESKVRMYAEEEIIMWGCSEMEFGEHPEFKPGDKVDIQIMRSGSRQHPLYGEIKVDEKTMKEVISNFSNDQRGIKLAVDENHEPNHKALGWFEKVYMKGKDALFATIELTRKGAQLLTDGAYQYFSPEIAFIKKDEESGKVIKNLLVGGAFTNRPFFKKMQPLLVAASEAAILSPMQFDDNQLFIFGKKSSMKTLIELIAKFAEAGKISKQDQELLKAEYAKFSDSELPADLKTAVEEALAFDETAGAGEGGEGGEGDGGEGSDKGGEEEKKPEADGGDGEGDGKGPGTVEANEDGTVTLQLSEYNALKAVATSAQKVVAEARKTMVTNQVESMVFTEDNKKGFITPKSKSKVVNFALSLSETKCNEFFEIIKEMKVLPFGEAGHSESTGSAEDQDAFKFFTEKLGMSPETAKEAVEAYKKG